VELPITIVIEPPSLVTLRGGLRCRWLWVSAIVVVLAVAVGLLVLVANVSRADALATSTSADLRISSRPAGAEAWIDGRAVGQTPAVVGVAPGAHQLQLKAEGAIDAGYALEVQQPGAAFHAALWRRQPELIRVRPALPGASLASARLQSDGQVALALDVGGHGELQAWQLDPITSAQEALPGSLAGGRLAVAPNGQRVATIGTELGPPSPSRSNDGRSVVWLSEAAQPGAPLTAIWHAPATDSLADLTWTPEERGLLAVTEQGSPTDRQVRTRLWLIDVDSGSARQLLALPSHVVPGAFSWRPDGRQVALLAHDGSLNALCLLDLEGEFRYLADLEPSSVLPLPYPPVTWSADSQRLAFAAPRQEPAATPSTWLQTRPRRVVYVSNAGAVAPRVLTELNAVGVAWREDGQLLALTRGRDSGLLVVLVDAAGHEQRLLELPMRAADAYAAQWDVGRARMLLASAAGSELDYWLVRLGLEEQP
jgi:PEGA domain